MFKIVKREKLKKKPNFKVIEEAKRARQGYYFHYKKSSPIPLQNLTLSNLTAQSNHNLKSSVLSSSSAELTLPNAKSNLKKSRKKGIYMLTKKDPKYKYLNQEEMNVILTETPSEKSFETHLKNRMLWQPHDDIRRAMTGRTAVKKNDTDEVTRSITSTSLSKALKKKKGKSVLQSDRHKLLSVNVRECCLIKRDNQIEFVNHKKSSLAEKIFFKVAAPYDCIEEHITSNIRPEDKYARFKMLLKKQETKNNRLINNVKQAGVVNENLLKFYITKLITKRRKSFVV